MIAALDRPKSDEEGRGHRQTAYLMVCAAILIVAALVRGYGTQNDLWLDEIWSVGLARKVSSPVDIFTKIHHDNNHYLNTLYLYLIGPQDNWPGYRMPSLLAGIGTVVLAGLIGRRRNMASALLAMLVTGSSYVMIVYSSEARGYAPAVFFSFLSFYLLDRYLETRRWPYALTFSLTAVLGFLAQLVFLGFYAAALVWSGYRLMKSRLGPKQIVIAVIACHAIPILVIAVIYFADLRYIIVGGGTTSTLLSGYTSALAWALGTPNSHIGILATCAIAVVILIIGVDMLWRESPDLCVFFVGAILVFPILLAVASGSSLFYVRYFIIGIAFFLILFSFVLADLYQRSHWGKAISVLLLLAYVAANGWHVASLLTYGRGQYRDAIRFMADRSTANPMTIGGDHDFRIGTEVNFYGPEVMGQRNFAYIPYRAWPPQGPEWLILQSESFMPPRPRADEIRIGGNRFALVKVYPTAPLSGLHWFVFHNEGQ